KAARILETRQMIGKLKYLHMRQFELPLAAPIEFEPREVPMDPYCLGLLLGDGCLTTSRTPEFTTTDPELALGLELGLEGIELHHKDRFAYVLRRRGGGRGSRSGSVPRANAVTGRV